MQNKINRRFIEIAIFSIIVTTIVMVSLFYGQMRKQVFADLKVIANVLIDEQSFDKKTSSVRVTLVDPNGDVAFDSTMDEQSLENHLNRPEIKEAMKDGYGQDQRLSDTLSRSVFYYAQKLDNGQILRVGREAQSVWSIFISSMPLILVMAVILSVICLGLSRYLTLEIVKPINRMAGDMDNIRDEDCYPELVPFTHKIRTQHEEILNYANIRQEFTANVTHELKTPVTAISGYAELMESGLAEEKDIKRFSGEIRKSAARLLTLINDIIKLSQFDSGNACEVLEVVDLAEIARESVEMLAVGAASKGITISYEGVDSANVKLGRELAQEIVYNLIENGVRYNKPEGLVIVRVNMTEENTSDAIASKHADRVVLSVQDTGIGIPEEHQERIFERFYRVDKSRSKELGGTGLGLAIVKHICTLTGGNIELFSKVGVGTTINISWDRDRIPER